jgi:hypothetical protein
MDADDICLPSRLSSQYEFMQHHPEVVALGSSAHFINETGEMICTYIPPANDSVLQEIFPGSPFIHPSVMLVKEAFIKAGKYPDKMKWGGEDVVLFARIAKHGLLHNLSEPLICYRLVPSSMSRKPAEFRAYLSSLIDKEINGKRITSEEFRQLKSLYVPSTPSHALYDYHFEIAKLNLWCGNSIIQNNIHLRSCLKLRGMNFKLLLIFLVSCMPGSLVKYTYLKLKKRIYK